jgi:hypothetical protein
MPGLFRDDADIKSVSCIGTGSAIKDEKLPALRMSTDFLQEMIEGGNFHPPVDGSPPNVVDAGTLRDNKPVLRRSAGP